MTTPAAKRQASVEPVPRRQTPDVSHLPAGEPTTFDVTYAPLAQTLPDRTRLLVVTVARDGDRELFRLDLLAADMTREQTTEDVRQQGRPDFSMASIMREERWREAYLRLRYWWKDKYQLNSWLDELMGADKTDAERLIVWDRTDYQIPWELFYSEQHDDWLGAQAEVVRWTVIHDRARVTRYTATLGACVGTVLAAETDDIRHTHDAYLAEMLEPYGTVPKQSLEELLDQLRDLETRYGLILVRCHGLFDQDGNFLLGGLTMEACDEYGMPALKQSNAVVVLNACTSATAQANGVHSERASSSFAEIFLRKGASSVIATVGAISFDHSHEFAARLLESPNQDQRLGTVLLEHRRQAATAVLRPRHGPDTRMTGDFAFFFQSFAYVHFGHPDTILRLIPAPPQRPERGDGNA